LAQTSVSIQFAIAFVWTMSTTQTTSIGFSTGISMGNTTTSNFLDKQSLGGWLEAGLLSDCHPQHSTMEVADGHLPLSTVMAPKASTSQCHNEPVVEDADMMEQCKAFCNITDEQYVPVLMGSPFFGMSLAYMDAVCHGSEGGAMLHDPEAMENCEMWSESLDYIKLAYMHFNNEKIRFEAEQELFQAMMQKKQQDMTDEFQSEAFIKQMEALSRKNRLEFLKHRVEMFRDDKGLVQAHNDLREKMSALTFAGRSLDHTVTMNIQKFKKYLMQCNRLLLSKSKNNEYLLDICAQDGNNCIEHNDGRHVGCCCGQNPLGAFEKFEIAGSAAVPGAYSFVPVQADRRLSSRWTFDMCAEMSRETRSEVSAARDRIRDLGQQQITQEAANKIARRYPDYARHCAQASVKLWSGRRLAQFQDSEKAGPEIGEAEFATPELPTMDIGRSLAANCNLGISGAIKGHNIKVAIPRRATGDEIRLPRREHPREPDSEGYLSSAQVLREVCEKFCQGGVPLLLGTLQYGFNLDEMNEICLPTKGGTDATLKYDENHLVQCASKGQSLHQVTQSATSFEVRREALQSTKLNFQEDIRTTVQALQKHMLSNEYRLTMERVSANPDAQVNEIRKVLKKFLGPVTEDSILNSKADALVAAANHLLVSVVNAEKDLEWFLRECDDLYLAVGSSAEYMLDFGAQQGNDCIDAEYASHVGCCCAHNPLTGIGTANLDRPIAGLDAKVDLGFKSEESIGDHFKTGAFRRLAHQQTDAHWMDFCASVWNESRYEQAEIHAPLMHTSDGAAKVLSLHRDKVAVYGQDYCAPFPCNSSRCELEDLQKYVAEFARHLQVDEQGANLQPDATPDMGPRSTTVIQTTMNKTNNTTNNTWRPGRFSMAILSALMIWVSAL